MDFKTLIKAPLKILVILAVGLYVIAPIDAIPDVPIIGWIDDFFVILVGIGIVKGEGITDSFKNTLEKVKSIGGK